jgi:hypothetical protein
MTVEATKPHKRWKSPLTEILAMSAALLMCFFQRCFELVS